MKYHILSMKLKKRPFMRSVEMHGVAVNRGGGHYLGGDHLRELEIGQGV